MTTTDKADIDRAVAFAVAELRRRGGTAEDIAALVKLMSDDNQESEEVSKPATGRNVGHTGIVLEIQTGFPLRPP